MTSLPSTTPDPADPSSLVRLSVPARPEFVQVLRVAVRAVAGRAGCSDDARSRLQAATGAAFFEVVDRAEPGSYVHATLGPAGGRMTVTLDGCGAQPHGDAQRVTTSRLDPTSVAGLADGHELILDGHGLRVWVEAPSP